MAIYSRSSLLPRFISYMGIACHLTFYGKSKGRPTPLSLFLTLLRPVLMNTKFKSYVSFGYRDKDIRIHRRNEFLKRF